MELGYNYFLTTGRGIWLYLYRVIEGWSRKTVAWNFAEQDDPAIAADLVSWAFLRERISKSRRQPLVLHSDNGNAMLAATIGSWLEGLGVLRSFSSLRLPNENPLFLVVIPNGEIPAGLPKSSIHLQVSHLSVVGIVGRLE